MTIDEKMVLAVEEIVELLGVGYTASRSEIKKLIMEKYQIAEGSLIPSDYCYNRVNDGISLSKPTLFEYLERGQYCFLGKDYPYNGDVYHKDQVVGKCRDGVREVFGIYHEEKPKGKEKKRSRDPSTRLRFQVLLRDGFTCRFCGASPQKDSSVTLHIDHIIPWSKGGETTLENLQTLCSKCNLGKSDLLLPADE